MAKHSTSRSFRVKGMTCVGCERTIERTLTQLNGVTAAKASFANNTVKVEYDPSVAGTLVLAAALEAEGYTLGDGQEKVRANANPQGQHRLRVDRWIGLALLLLAAWVLTTRVGNFLPEVNANMGYGMLFLVGLLTGVHCVAMCGGINLSQCVAPPLAADGPKARLRPALLYNAGRVVSYTALGGLVGALGSVVSLTGWARGLVAVVSGLFLLVMGISMLGIFPWVNRLIPRLPRALRARAGEARQGKGPFVVGLLNGLMPCGPLQAMQLYALGTGSPAAGALSMFVFSLGTVPLMLGLGALSSLLSHRFTGVMMKASAALVLLLGLVMVNRGLALSGVNLLPGSAGVPQAAAATASTTMNSADGVQTISSELTSSGYPAITVQAATPVRWTLHAEANTLNGCNRTLIIPAYDKQVTLQPGDNVIEFTPTKEGTVSYSCWMGMITSTITVVAADSAAPAQTAVAAATDDQSEPIGLSAQAGASCCASAALSPAFANGNIPTDDIALAQESGGTQVVAIAVSDQGYGPAVAVVERGKPLQIRFEAESLNVCNSYVSFPELGGALDLSDGELVTPVLTPDADFTFECGMGMLHGYVKVVDDLDAVNLDEVRREVAAWEPAASEGGCCG